MRQPDTAISNVPIRCEGCIVREQGMCAVLSADELSVFAGSVRRAHYAPGAVIDHADSAVASYANLTEGAVKLSRVLRTGKRQVVGLRFAPELLGKLFSANNIVTVEAASAVDVCRVPRETLETLVASNPALSRWLLDRTLRDLDDARDWIVTLGAKDARQRVASLLLLISQRCGTSRARNRVEFDLPLSRSDMADFLGLTIETVSRQISRLRREGIIEVADLRHVSVPDVAALVTRAG